MQKFGILTSGGDSPGMNAAIRSAVFAADSLGMEVLGFEHGYQGLHDKSYRVLRPAETDKYMRDGGTFLRTARFLPFKHEETRQAAIEQCLQNAKELGVEGLLVIGGDGSFRGALDLICAGNKKDESAGLPCICAPGTIDNDIACSEYSIGYDTCLNTILEMVDRLADTAYAHDRGVVIEVMGNMVGDLSLYSGMAQGASVILISETWQGQPSIDRAVAQIEAGKAKGQTCFLVFVAEGITHKQDKKGDVTFPGDPDKLHGAERLAKILTGKTGIETMAITLGHVQRGGRPSARDRIVATQMGAAAAKLFHMNENNRVMIVRQGVVSSCSIEEALLAQEVQEKNRAQKKLEPKLRADYELAQLLSLGNI
jgi:6-phosphofructokinase 1